MSEEAWAKARMWAWEQLAGWKGFPDSEGKRAPLGLIRRAEIAEALARWVMFGPSSVVDAAEAARVAEEPKA